MSKARWAGIVVALAAGAAAAAPSDTSCDATLKWMEDGNQVQIHFGEPALGGGDAAGPNVTIRLRRYQDAVRIGVTGADGMDKSILSLDGGPDLIFGASDPREFMEAGMPTMIPVYYLMQHYASPCEVPTQDVFTFRLDADGVTGGGPVQVSGKASRAGSRIDYELHVVSVPSATPGAGKRIDAGGHWAHVDPSPVGQDTDVRGSKVVVGMKVVEGAAPATIAEARAWGKR
jgi:hypothetical protein